MDAFRCEAAASRVRSSGQVNLEQRLGGRSPGSFILSMIALRNGARKLPSPGRAEGMKERSEAAGLPRRPPGRPSVRCCKPSAVAEPSVPTG